MERIFDRAGDYSIAAEHATPSRAGMLLSKALALAAVEVSRVARANSRESVVDLGSIAVAPP